MKPANINVPQLIDSLRNLVGSEVIYQGIQCRLLEILEDGPALVLQDCEANTTIQDNQYGGAWRRVPAIYTIPLTTKDGDSLHPDYEALRFSLVPH